MSKTKDKKHKKMPRWKRILRLRVWRFSKDWKLRERIGQANEWAKENPKKLFHWTVGILTLSLAITIFFTVLSFIADEQKEQKSLVGNEKGQIEDIQPMFNGLNQIENNRKQIKNEVKDMTNKGIEVKNELDSLCNLPYKTHEDSVRIYRDYRQLQVIVDYLKKGQK